MQRTTDRWWWLAVAAVARSAVGRPCRHRHAVEPERDDGADGDGGPGPAALGPAHGDGPGSRLRRRQRDRRRPRGLSAHVTSGDAVRLQGRSGGDGGLQRAARTSYPRSKPTLDAQYAASLAAIPDGSGEDARDRRRRSSGGRDDRGENRRRPLRRVPVPRRDRRRPVAARASGLRERPVRVAEGRASRS